MEGKEMYWKIRWTPALTPDMSMVPDEQVFAHSTGEYSLTATIEGATSLLLSPADTFFDTLNTLVNTSTALTTDTTTHTIAGHHRLRHKLRKRCGNRYMQMNLVG